MHNFKLKATLLLPYNGSGAFLWLVLRPLFVYFHGMATPRTVFPSTLNTRHKLIHVIDKFQYYFHMCRHGHETAGNDPIM